jgi:hypothetical protein
MSKLPASEEAEVVCKKCCHFIEALVQRCPEGGLCEAASRLPALSEDEIGSEKLDDKGICANCGHGVSIHEWEDESTSCCLYAHKLFAGVGEGKPCMCPGYKRTTVLTDGPAEGIATLEDEIKFISVAIIQGREIPTRSENIVASNLLWAIHHLLLPVEPASPVEWADEDCDHKECWQAAKNAVRDRRIRDFKASHPTSVVVPDGLKSDISADRAYINGARYGWKASAEGRGNEAGFEANLGRRQRLIDKASNQLKAPVVVRLEEMYKADLDALTDALGWNRGAMERAREIILQDAAALRPRMVKACRAASDAEGDVMLLHAIMTDESGLLKRVWDAKRTAERELQKLRNLSAQPAPLPSDDEMDKEQLYVLPDTHWRGSGVNGMIDRAYAIGKQAGLMAALPVGQKETK